MKAALAHLWREHRLLLIGFTGFVLLTLFFSVRATVQFVYWSDPAHQDQMPAGWMTPRYIAYSWEVPPEVISDALDMAQDGSGRRVTLADIAEARGTSVDALASELIDAIQSHRERQ